MLLDLIGSMRPRQWPKNAFVFVALLFDGKLLDLPSVLAVTAAFGLLCLMSGAVYIMNDLADVESDRQHPTKKNRPLASGRLNPRLAGVVSFLLAVVSLVAGYFLSLELAVILLLYLLSQIAYTFRLKHVVLLLSLIHI